MTNTSTRVLFVCMGNICRSPTAEGVFSNMLNRQSLTHLIEADSAGTHAYHIGNPPDARATATAKKHGVDLTHLVARKVTPDDFYHFDYIIAMDIENMIQLQAIEAKLTDTPKVSLHLFMEFATNKSHAEVPDPYYGGDKGFEQVITMVTDASEGLIKTILRS